jgi:hypothetical protein
MSLNGARLLEGISRYYDGCSNGDIDAMVATLHPEVVHYFLAPNPGSQPVAGALHLARYWRKVTSTIRATWVVDNAVTGEENAVIEWSMFWYPGGGQERIVTRGAEWFVFEGGLIREIRSYYQQRDSDTELDEFPYAERSYSLAGRESSSIHDPQLRHTADQEVSS